jgi:hypothetical protein
MFVLCPITIAPRLVSSIAPSAMTAVGSTLRDTPASENAAHSFLCA